MQREREQSQRDERERIKQQIKADREERKRIEQVRKQNEATTTSDAISGSATQMPVSKNIRVQARMFDGGTQKHTFPPTATISKDVRPWLDEFVPSTPYSLKIILTPLPNHNIEAAEEDQPLTDLGIRGSATLVLVPVKGYVDSYAGSGSSYVGTAVSGGYNLVTGTAGALLGGVKSVLGYGATVSPSPTAPDVESSDSSTQPKVRVRTLADQRAEQSKKDQQFYNGNQLNFEPRRDDVDKRSD